VIKQRLVVIGNGMAGARTVEEILARGGDFDITMFGDEPYGNYNRIMLSNVLAGVEDESGIFLNDLSWYAENGITLHAGVRIDRIDRKRRTVHGADGSETPYDKLVIATGSSAFVPPIKGAHVPGRGYHQGVFVFRTLDDTRAMIRYAKEHERAVVIGGGLLGLEAARGLQNHMPHVTLVHAVGHLMERQLNERAGATLKTAVEQKLGIDVIVNGMTTEITGKHAVTGVKLADGRLIECDVVVVAAGIRPNTQVAAESGLVVERLRAIGIPAQVTIMRGDPAFLIPFAARKWSSDLILVRAHNRIKFRNWLLGSVAKSVVEYAPCSVEVVRADQSNAIGRNMRILLPTDGSEASLAATQAIAEMEFPHDTEVKVVSVINPIKYSLEEIGLLRGKNSERAHRAIGKAVNMLGSAPLNITAEVIAGRRVRQIVSRARDWDADLIVVGTAERQGLKRLSRGTAVGVANRAHCSVRVVRGNRVSHSEQHQAEQDYLRKVA